MSSARRPGADQLALDIPGWTAGARAVILWSITIHGKTGPRHEWAVEAARALDAGADMVSNPLDFAITTGVWQPGGRDIVSGGATVEPLRELVTYVDGFDADKAAALASLERWHLNAMRAGCAHQEPVYAPDDYGRNVPSLDLTPPCPVTGYKYGHAWLVEELPAGFVDRLKELLPPEKS